MATRNLRLLEAFTIQEVRDVPHDLHRTVEVILNKPGRTKPRYTFDPQCASDDDGDLYLQPSAGSSATCECCETSGRWVREDLGSGGGSVDLSGYALLGVLEGAEVETTVEQDTTGGEITVDFETAIRNDNGVAASTDRLIGVTGNDFYPFACWVKWKLGADGTYKKLRVLKNGTTQIGLEIQNDFVNNGERVSKVSGSPFLMAGDYLQILASSDSTDDGALIEEARFSMVKRSGGGVDVGAGGTPTGICEGFDIEGDFPSALTIIAGAVTTEKLGDLAVTEPKLADEAVSSRTIVPGAVLNEHLGEDFVGSGASSSRGPVPDPGATAGINRFLCEEEGNPWKVPPTLPVGFFGDGSDGSMTLSGHTTLASGDCLKNLQDLDLAGFTLTVHTNDLALVIGINGTFSPSGGKIQVLHRVAGGVGGAAGGLTSGGVGGNGGGSTGCLAIFARHRVDASIVTLSARGQDGTDGTDAGTRSSTDIGASGADAVITQARLKGYAITVTAATKGAASVTSAPTTSVGGSAMTAAQKRVFKSIASWLYPEDGLMTFFSDNRSKYWNETTTGAGGGGGRGTNLNVYGSQGGAGGGWYAAGGKGGEPGAGSAAAGNGSAGSGGGGGGPAGIVIYVSLDDGDGVTIDVSGGDGGDAGDANQTAGETKAGGSGGGGGGGGGFGISFTGGTVRPSFIVNGGVGGLKGLPQGSASTGNDGADGDPGEGVAVGLDEV